MKKLINKIKNLKKSQKIALSIIILLVLLLIISGITYAVIINTSTEEVAEETVEVEEKYAPELTATYEVDESTNIVVATITSTDSISKIELKTLSTSEEEAEEESTDVEVIYQAETGNDTEEVEYTYTLDETWVTSTEATEGTSDEEVEETLSLSKEYTENCNETYRVTFENKDYSPQEIEVEITSFEEVTLEVDTAGLEEGTEVTILTYEDGTIEVITSDDPDYDSKVASATSVSSGTITSSGITLSTVNSTLINMSTLSTEEQSSSVTVTNTTTSSEEESTDGTEENDTSTSSGTISTTSSNTGSSTTSNGSTSTSSTSTSSGSSISSSSSSSGTSSSNSSSTTYYYYSLVSGVNTELCNLINSERSSLGIYTLSISSSLQSAAEDWAYTMAVNGAISHNYYNVNASEIVLATTSSSASHAWSNIQNSSSHYTIATLNDSDAFTSIGAACVYDGVGSYYWCIYVG